MEPDGTFPVAAAFSSGEIRVGDAECEDPLTYDDSKTRVPVAAAYSDSQIVAPEGPECSDES